MPGRKQALEDVNSLLEFLIALRETIDAKLEELGVEDDPDTDDPEVSDDSDED